jgi:hypothetical protein
MPATRRIIMLPHRNTDIATLPLAYSLEANSVPGNEMPGEISKYGRECSGSVNFFPKIRLSALHFPSLGKSIAVDASFVY